MRKFLVLFFVAILNIFVSGQTKVNLFPGELNIQPFSANALEPRIGFLFQVNNNELRLDAGNSLDVINIRNNNSVLSFGADMFTYTLLRGEKDFHFPVDAVDYLFGINAGYKVYQGSSEYGIRTRLSHISAHFVDGHYDKGQWRDGQAPRVYSREFLELMPYYRINNLRFYAGYTYIYHIDPAYLGKNNYQAGFDFYFKGFLPDYITPFAAYDIKMIKINEYSANHSLNAGLKIGFSRGRGLSIYYSYYSGKSIHGEYFNYNKNYSAVGFNLDI